MDTLLEAAIVCGLDSRPDSLSVRSLNCYDFYTISVLTSGERPRLSAVSVVYRSL